MCDYKRHKGIKKESFAISKFSNLAQSKSKLWFNVLFKSQGHIGTGLRY